MEYKILTLLYRIESALTYLKLLFTNLVIFDDLEKYFSKNIRFLFPSEKVRNVLVGPELSALVQVDLVVVEVGGVSEEQPHAALEAGQAVLGRVVGVAVTERVHEAVEVGQPVVQRGLDNVNNRDLSAEYT